MKSAAVEVTLFPFLPVQVRNPDLTVPGYPSTLSALLDIDRQPSIDISLESNLP